MSIGKNTDAQLKAIEYLILTLCDKYPKIKEKAKLQTDYSGISGNISRCS